MQLPKIKTVVGRAVPVAGDDIDTDRIIPARFMKCVTFDGLGAFAFYDERVAADGSRKGHPFDDPARQGATILVSGRNFGCGSSREHAPQALYRYGIRAILAESFAEIFFGNATTLGVPCATLARADLDALMRLVAADAVLEITVDVEHGNVRAGDTVFPCAVREGARKALLNGKWDAIAELLESKDAIDTLAKALPQPVVL